MPYELVLALLKKMKGILGKTMLCELFVFHGLALTDMVRGSCWPAEQEQMIQTHVQNYSSF